MSARAPRAPMTARAKRPCPALVPAPTVRQLGAAPELATLAILEAAIQTAIPALLTAQPELLAADPDAGGSSSCSRCADQAIQLGLELRAAINRYRLALADDPERDHPLPF